MLVKYNVKSFNIRIMQEYASTTDTFEEDHTKFYNDLNRPNIIVKIPAHCHHYG